MRSILLLTVLAAVGAWAIVQELPEAAADVVHGNAGNTIQSIAFDGAHLPIAALRDALSTHPGEVLDRTKLDRDKLALEAVLAARGYLAAQVDEGRVTFDASGAAFVTFAISTGAVFHVRSIVVAGASEKDAGVMTIAKGEIVLPDRLAHARDAIAERLKARGKSSTVALNVVPDEATATADIILTAH